MIAMRLWKATHLPAALLREMKTHLQRASRVPMEHSGGLGEHLAIAGGKEKRDRLKGKDGPGVKGSFVEAGIWEEDPRSGEWGAPGPLRRLSRI